MNSLIPDCTSKCQSLKHALDVLSVVTKGSENQIKAFLSSHCYNATTIKDAFGRNALHLVSSCGKKGVLDWLIEKGVDLLVKDKESGWTALHRSIFYGHIDCVWSLLKHGVSLYIQDKEGLSALDLVMKDRPTHVVFKNTDPTDVYTWGDNTNFTLGHGSQNSKHHPELVDLFSRSGVYIKQIPRLVEGLSGHNCSQVAAAKDHTVVLTEDGCVYTFGLNIFHQLGIIPPPSSCNVPRQMQAKYLKGRTVIGVAAGRFHTVLWTREAVYTLGLNGGQLGYLLDPNGEKCVTAPRQVSALHHKDITLSLVAASDGATVCVTTRGDIYLLADYQCKKMASKQLNLKKVLVSGGCMEYKVDPEHLKENGGQNICILAMDGAGRVFCWRSASSSLKQCRWAYPRQVFISDIALSRNEILFVTQDGEGFRGKWFEEKRKSSEKKDILSNLHNSSSDVSCVSDINSVYERIRLEKLTFAHRAVSVSTDPSGCNFAILQSDPKTRLDGVRFENEKINVIAKKTGDTLKNVSLTTWEIVNKPDILASSCAALEMPIHSDILKVILDYLYTDEAVVIKDNVFILKYILILHLDSNKFKMYENKHLKLSKSLLYTSGKTNSVESLPELLTSDSEGSYAGLGSPRDLQSPDFTTGFHSDKIEGKVKPYVNGIPPTYSKEDLKPWEKSPILKISAPQLIPSNKIDTTSSSSWVAGSFSPVSPPVVDLRTIMEIEESRQKCGATPKSNLGKMISHGVKLSQKQRKMIALTTKENSGMNIMEAVLTTPSKAPKPVNAWASSLHSVSSKSFRDFLVEEKKSMTGHSSGDHVKKVCFKGIESSQTPKVVRCSARGTPGPEGNHISDLPLLDSPNPWLSSSVTAPSVVAPVTFASIVEEELQQEAALIRSREKPLALIQIEEHAIQDLLVFYEAFGNPDEFVIVERTPQGPLAVPMWNKHGC
uniref:Inhibitor of Bruton tyrosine kinase n=1 Tax=Propithecus coquereli TaxID=379532 RepID=A0A2K6GZJ7_PROCO